MIPKSFSSFLALRYLTPKRTYVSVITCISVIGVLLGVMILILVISVMTGFEIEVKKQLLGLEPHIRAIEYNAREEGAKVIDWREVRDQLAATENAQHVYPFISGEVLMEVETPSGSFRQAPLMLGYPEDDEVLMGRLGEQMRNGQASLYEEHDAVQMLSLEQLEAQDTIEQTQTSSDVPPAIISNSLADTYGLEVGMRFTVFSPKNVEEILDTIKQAQKEGSDDEAVLSQIKELIQPQEVRISGIFNDPTYGNIVILPLHIAQELYSLGDDVHGLGIITPDAFKAGQYNQEIVFKHLPPNWMTETWMDRNQARFGAIRTERSIMYFILFFIILVAAFSISNTMITVTVQKRAEIGVMKAIGAKVYQIVWIFLTQGMLVGFFGTLLGLASGTLLVQFRNPVRQWLSSAFGIDPFPISIYGLSDIPAKIVPSDVGVICVGAFIICSLAALPPAWFVARLDPAKALRNM